MEKKKYINPSIDTIDMAVIQTDDIVATSTGGGSSTGGDDVVGGQ